LQTPSLEFAHWCDTGVWETDSLHESFIRDMRIAFHDQYQSNHPYESDKTRQEQQDIANGYNQAFDDVSEIHAPPLA
jgi:hypothetical protein